MIKTRIIVTFSILTALVVSVMAWVSYISVRAIYLDQMEEQTALITRSIAASINTRNLMFVDPPVRSNLAFTHYHDQLQTYADGALVTSVFIFDQDLRIRVRSGSAVTVGEINPRLLLSRREIEMLEIGTSTTSPPFQGPDELWYLWGFYRLDNSNWLGIQESADRLAHVESLSTIFSVIGVGGILLTVVAGWVLAKSVARPINRLVSFSQVLGEGEFNHPTPQSVRGELAILAAAMDKMRLNLSRHDQEKERILAQIAHEIRNPLGGIELLAGLVREDLQKQSANTTYIEKILSELADLKALISSYLHYSRPIPAVQKDVNIHTIVENTIEAAVAQDTHSTIKISNQCEKSIVRFDPAHLRQITLNLLNNSINALSDKEQGSIIFSTERAKDSVALLISDNGPGIPAENAEAIFEPFFTTRADGTGLGLAVCKKLAADNGARIRMRHSASDGATFEIAFAANDIKKRDGATV